MPTNQEPYNENNERHGLWVRYYDGEDSIMCRGAYVNGKRHGFWETNYSGNELAYKGTYDMDKKVGNWIINRIKVFYAD